MDLWRPAPIESLGQNLYALDLTDDQTCYTTDYYLKMKDQAFAMYKAYNQTMEMQHRMRMKMDGQNR